MSESREMTECKRRIRAAGFKNSTNDFEDDRSVFAFSYEIAKGTFGAARLTATFDKLHGLYA